MDDSGFAQPAKLVGHEGQQGKEHQGGAREEERGKLEAQGLAGSRGQDDDLRPSLQRVGDDESLMG